MMSCGAKRSKTEGHVAGLSHAPVALIKVGRQRYLAAGAHSEAPKIDRLRIANEQLEIEDLGLRSRSGHRRPEGGKSETHDHEPEEIDCAAIIVAGITHDFRDWAFSVIEITGEIRYRTAECGCSISIVRNRAGQISDTPFSSQESAGPSLSCFRIINRPRLVELRNGG